MLSFISRARFLSGVVSSAWKRMAHQNRLAAEKSPYLLQHAHNPVDWYPWGNEAFQKARNENKMIFLSVGYSTCHWCHVMEKESFENEAIAKVMNDNFVNIKVDREERPDVDRIYMTFVQATSGSGGWPMSVWLTPELEPIMAGTYYPPQDTDYGEPGFLSICKNLATRWREHQASLKEQASHVVELVGRNVNMKMPRMVNASPQAFIDLCLVKMAGTYDRQFGGFGHAPKFPQPVNFNFLFRIYYLKHAKKREALEMAIHTLKMMAKGGIRDHIGMGFHRYSTDRQWHVPHFEKMLYDQAQLIVSYLEAFQITKEQLFADVAKEILEYVSRDLTHVSGGIFSAEDADSLSHHSATEKKEGAFYVWTHQEIQNVLTGVADTAPHIKVADVFCYHYKVKPTGNVNPAHDSRNELAGQNMLMSWASEDETAEHFKLSWSEVHKILAESRRALYWVRQKRPRPHLDCKLIAAWNGLMISAFSKAYQMFKEESYKNRALEAAHFIRKHLYQESNNRLLRSAYCTQTDETVNQLLHPIPGSLSDYAFVIRGLLDLYEATFQAWSLEWALELQTAQDTLFWDRQNKGYFTTDPSDPTLVIKLKEDQDGAEPSGCSVAATNLVRLAYLLNQLHLKAQATELLALYQSRLDRIPHAFPEMVVAALWTRTPPVQIMVIGDLNKESTRALISTINSFFLPFKVLLLGDPDDQNCIYKNFEFLRSLRRSTRDEPIVFICEQFTCKPAITSMHQLELELSKLVI